MRGGGGCGYTCCSFLHSIGFTRRATGKFIQGSPRYFYWGDFSRIPAWNAAIAPTSQRVHPGRPDKTARNKQVQPEQNAVRGRARSLVADCMSLQTSLGLREPIRRFFSRDCPQAWQNFAPGMNSVVQSEQAMAVFAGFGMTVT